MLQPSPKGTESAIYSINVTSYEVCTKYSKRRQPTFNDEKKIS